MVDTEAEDAFKFGCGAFDEMHHEDGGVRTSYAQYRQWLEAVSQQQIEAKRKEADLIFRRTGITFSVSGDESSDERLIPSDVIPRIIPAQEWRMLEAGLIQRVTAINRFLQDVYGEQAILKAKKIPADLVLTNRQYQVHVVGIQLPHGVFANITGVDIVRSGDGNYYVLEDNLRVPSGVSYMLSNRMMIMRLFQDVFSRHRVHPVDHYPALLLQTLRSLSSESNPTVVLLTPGRFNSAYFEHTFLAKRMGVELVEGQDLMVKGGKVWMRTTSGLEQVHVIYRRMDDDYLDPISLNPDSHLGVAGLMVAYRMGHVAIANAVGTGVADDKSVYPYVPEMIRFYLGEEPIIQNVTTWQCREAADLQYVLAHLPELVVKEVHGAGGYGMLVGPTSSKAEIEQFRQVLTAAPDNYIAQPTLSLSTCPTFVDEGIAPRHIDLRPFVLSGAKVQVVPGGLTRVALRQGSLVVNSSQGGGTKDTWVLVDDEVAEGGELPPSTQGDQ